MSLSIGSYHTTVHSSLQTTPLKLGHLSPLKQLLYAINSTFSSNGTEVARRQ